MLKKILLAVALLVAVLIIIRIAFFPLYSIPTSSMAATIKTGDHVFVNKIAYGLRVSANDSKKYKRRGPRSPVAKNDVVVFNFPEGDSVASNVRTPSFQSLVRMYGRQRVTEDMQTFGEVLSFPVNQREVRIARCVAIPGDSFELRDGQVYINNQKQPLISSIQFDYFVETDGTSIPNRALEKIGISRDNIQALPGSTFLIPMTEEQSGKIEKLSIVSSVKQANSNAGAWDPNTFPSSEKYPWNVDNFGPLEIPQKGQTIDLTLDNLPLYSRLIQIYEEHDLLVKDNTIYIDGQATDKYTFLMNYYWVMGDNRHNSADSRYWGFLPENHLIGEVIFVL